MTEKNNTRLHFLLCERYRVDGLFFYFLCGIEQMKKKAGMEDTIEQITKEQNEDNRSFDTFSDRAQRWERGDRVKQERERKKDMEGPCRERE